MKLRAKQFARNLFAVVALGAATACLSAMPTQASTIYTYTGNFFDSTLIIDANPPTGDYKPAMKVTGSFELLNPLGNGLIDVNILASPDLVGFSFSDGRNTITNTNAGTKVIFVTIGGSGNIIDWKIELTMGSMSALGDQIGGISSYLAFDAGYVAECTTFSFFCTNQSDSAVRNLAPGTWAISTGDTSVVPLPAALPLFATGLGLLAFVARRRKQKQAARAAA
jgi:hypothetical protein